MATDSVCAVLNGPTGRVVFNGCKVYVKTPISVRAGVTEYEPTIDQLRKLAQWATQTADKLERRNAITSGDAKL